MSDMTGVGVAGLEVVMYESKQVWGLRECQRKRICVVCRGTLEGMNSFVIFSHCMLYLWREQA